MQTIAPNFSPALTPQPVLGGGGMTQVTRVRWGRILIVMVGAALVVFGSWQAMAGGVKTDATPRTVSGGGSLDIEAPARTVAPAIAAPEAPTTAAPKTTSKPGAAAKRAAAKRAAAKRAAAKRAAAKRTAAKRTAAKRAAGVAAIASTATAADALAAPTAPMPVASGGGTDGSTAMLPYTGLETWVAAILGIIILGLGICVQVNAVRIGMTAMLYRRGILLRPIDCARLAHQRGLPQLRVAISNALTRLLAEPTRVSDFATSRHA